MAFNCQTRALVGSNVKNALLILTVYHMMRVINSAVNDKISIISSLLWLLKKRSSRIFEGLFIKLYSVNKDKKIIKHLFETEDDGYRCGTAEKK